MLASISYRGKQAKVPYEAQTPIFALRDAAVSALAPTVESATLRLKQGKTELDHTLPARLALRIRNANLELGAPASTFTTIRVKVRGGSSESDWTGDLPPDTSIGAVAEAAGIPGAALMLYDHEVNAQMKLQALGSASVAFSRASGKNKLASSSSQTAERNQSTNQHAPVPKTTTTPAPNAPVNGERDTRVIIHSDPVYRRDSPPPEPSQGQLQSYYTHLQQMGSNKPLMSQETRDKLTQARRAPVDAIAVRIKLPDGTHVEGRFYKADHGSHVYDFVRGLLRDPKREFQLELASPHYVLQPEDALIGDLRWTSSVLLRLRYIQSGQPAPAPAQPLLSDKALAMASPRPKVDASGSKPTKAGEEAPQGGREPRADGTPKSPNDSEQDQDKKSKKLFHRPKWLKFNK